jgi:general secretion pathway protein L
MISVGIDIGRASVKVAEAETIARTFVIKRFLEFPISQDPNKDKRIEIIDILRNLIPQYGLDSTKFVFCVRQEDVSLRLKQFPFRERHKILRAVPFEVEDEIPFSQSDAIFEAKVIRYEGRAADVLAMACPKDRIKDVIQFAHDGGAHPSVVSLETAALANFFENWDAPPTEIAPLSADIIGAQDRVGELVIDVGHSTTKCLFFDNGALIAVRHIDWGGRNIVGQIAQKYGLSVIQATKELEAKSFIALDKSATTKEQNNFSKVIETSVLDLVRELRLKIIEVKADHRLDIAKAHMTGGVAAMRGFGGFLTQNLEIAFNRLKLLSLLPNVTFEADAHAETVAGVAIGLAIEGLKRPRNPAVNFLKDEFAKQSQTLERLWEKWGYAVKLASAAFVVFFIYAFIRDSMTSNMRDISDDALRSQAGAIANLKGSAASSSKIKKFLSEHEREQKARKQAEKVLKLNSPLDILNMISQNLPERNVVVDIKHFNVEGENVQIEGYLLNSTRLKDVQEGLRPSSVDGKVEPMTTQLSAQGGKQPFGFRFHVSRTEGG